MKTISELYELQKQLDARIIKEKGLEGQDLLPNTILALQVEIGELANEWRGFKHWSNDREPRTTAKCIVCNGKGEIYSQHDLDFIDCNHCEGSGKENDKNPLLEEYVDCLHFFLSIARQLEMPTEELEIIDRRLDNDTVRSFSNIITAAGLIDYNDHDAYFDAWCYFRELGTDRLGFTWKQIAEAYLAKNKINHERQESGY